MQTETDEELIMLSALQHFAFCERQCALIHVEQQWKDNRLTVLGEQFHERVHSGEREWRNGHLIVRSLKLVSNHLGLTGQADQVDFIPVEKGCGIHLPGEKGEWRPYPVEYKKGKPKVDNIDEVQLCAQAMCLEERLSFSIPEGALYYGAQKRRHPVLFSKELRGWTENLSKRLHALVKSGITPGPVYMARCNSCSLFDICQPKWAALITKSKYQTIVFEGSDEEIT